MKIKFLDDFKKKQVVPGVLFNLCDFEDKYFDLSSEFCTKLLGRILSTPDWDMERKKNRGVIWLHPEGDRFKVYNPCPEDLLQLCYYVKRSFLFFNERNEILSQSEGHARAALKNFIHSLVLHWKEIKEELKIPFDELKNMFGRDFKKLCEEHGESKLGEMHHNKEGGFRNMRWYPKNLCFAFHENEGSYKAVYAATITNLCTEAYVDYKMSLDHDIFTKKRTDRIRNCFSFNNNVSQVLLRYRGVKQEYDFLTSQIMRLAIALVERWHECKTEPISVLSLLHQCNFREIFEYEGLNAVFYPIKQEGDNFYDYSGNLLSYEAASLHYLLRDFFQNLVMMSNDPILQEIKKEIYLGFNQLKDMFGPCFKEVCERLGENRLGEFYYYNSYDQNFWPKGIGFYNRYEAAGYQMVFRDKLNDLTQKHFDNMAEDHSFFKAGGIFPV